jgi:tryptophanyl-tRNA synthetase
MFETWLIETYSDGTEVILDTKEEKFEKRIFSGIQPTGNIHIGNYLGAIMHWVVSQEAYDNIFCVVDLHAITIPQDPEQLKKKLHETAGLLLAAGINPKRSVLFIQSHISAHTELAWILNGLVSMGQMQRMTQFKEKSKGDNKNITVGLFNYPLLMAADILLYKTDLVPVGEDQKQHLEFTRHVAQRFNTLYGDTFRIPKPIIPKKGARIMGLDNPLKKMSKSEKDHGHAINLLDSPEDILSKVMKATTDSFREIRFDKNRPGVQNLLVIYELFTGESREIIEARFAGKGYIEFKRELSELIIERLKPIQSRYGVLMEDSNHIDRILAKGAEKIRPIAESVLGAVKDNVGLG